MINSDKQPQPVESAISISVITCKWYRAFILQETLHSLNAQRGCKQLDIEVLIVDNNSTDRTKAIVEDTAQSWRLETLSYLFEPRQGKQFALNTAIRNAWKSVLAFTDHEIIFSPDWISNIRSVFCNTQADLVGDEH